MRKIAASYIFPVSDRPVKNGILEISDNGTIIRISFPGESDINYDEIEYFDGFLVPGLVNAHCHLELSYLRDKINSGKGLGGFIGEINKLRNLPGFDQESAITESDHEMFSDGVAAVGDISNTNRSLGVKLSSSIFYHTFAEAFGFLPSRAERAFDLAVRVYNDFRENGLEASVVPHSPYSVSEPLWGKIIQHACENKSILTFHNQESHGENQFFLDGTGPIANHLKNIIGLDISGWMPTGKNSIQSVLNYFPPGNRLILVHNTYTGKEDIDFIRENRSMDNTFFCVCPNSNLYIENKLPDIHLFRNEKINICLGTDSLASNTRLSVLSEMIALQTSFPELSLEELMRWACLNGALTLNIDNRFGSLEPGKSPGVNLITNVDIGHMKLLPESGIKRLV